MADLINWTNLGFGGPSSFAAAGPAQTIVVYEAGLGFEATIAGGVILGSPSGPPLADAVVYGTASKFGNVNPDPSLKDSITISFDGHISNFTVDIFNGLPTSAEYEVTDGVDPPDIITLQPNSSTSDTEGPAGLSVITTAGPTTITITPVGTGPWDFFIDNIITDFNTTDVNIVKAELVSATTSQVYDLATTISVLGAALATLGASPNLVLFFFDAQDSILELNALANEADVEAAAGPAASAAAAATAGVPAQGAAAAFDPNYKQPYTPTFVQFSTIQSDSTITPHNAADANTALKDLSLAIGYMQALDVTINRLNSAIQQNDQASTNLQNAEFDTFLGLSSASLAAVAKDFNALANDFTGVSLPTLTAPQISSFINNVKTNGLSGLPPQEQTLFNTIGVSAADEQSIVSAISSINPSTVPTSLVSSLQQLGTSLQSIADVYNGKTSPTAPVFPFTGDSSSQIETTYIAYFGRAGDPGGTSYWGAQLASGALSISQEAASFSVQPESLAQYPFLVNPLTASTTGTNNALDGFINSVYQNLFGHVADGTDTTGGLGYWRGNILTALATNNTGIIAQELGVFCIQVAFGALGTDQTSLTNKVTVADYFTQALISSGISFTSAINTLAHSAIASVTSASSTVTAAEATISSFLATHPSGTEVGVVGTSEMGSVHA